MKISRGRNTMLSGQVFPTTIVDRVWNKGTIIPGYSPFEWRYDPCGFPIKLADYGNTDSQYGWEIDHIFPTAKGGLDTLNNLQPLQWENNRRKGDNYPWHYGNHEIRLGYDARRGF